MNNALFINDYFQGKNITNIVIVNKAKKIKVKEIIIKKEADVYANEESHDKTVKVIPNVCNLGVQLGNSGWFWRLWK